MSSFEATYISFPFVVIWTYKSCNIDLHFQHIYNNKAPPLTYRYSIYFSKLKAFMTFGLEDHIFIKKLHWEWIQSIFYSTDAASKNLSVVQKIIDFRYWAGLSGPHEWAFHLRYRDRKRKTDCQQHNICKFNSWKLLHSLVMKWGILWGLSLHIIHHSLPSCNLMKTYVTFLCRS